MSTPEATVPVHPSLLKRGTNGNGNGYRDLQVLVSILHAKILRGNLGVDELVKFFENMPVKADLTKFLMSASDRRVSGCELEIPVLPMPGGCTKQDADSWRRALEEGRITPENLRGFVIRAGRGVFPLTRAEAEDQTPATLEDAKNILGLGNVIPAEEVYEAWKLPHNNDVRIGLGYTKSQLRRCLKENLDKRRQWELVYIIGLSAPQMLGIRGSDVGKPPAMIVSETWKRQLDGYLYLNEPLKSGYYLIDRSCGWLNGGIIFEAQEIKLRDNGCVRLNDCAAIEIAFTHQLARRELIYQDVHHCGVSHLAHGSLTCRMELTSLHKGLQIMYPPEKKMLAQYSKIGAVAMIEPTL